MKNQSLIGIGSLIIASFIWGIAYIPTRYLGNNHFGVFFEVLIRYSIPALLFGILYFKQLKNASFSKLKKCFIAGIILFLSLILSIQGIRTIQYGSIGLLLISLNIIFVPVFNSIIFKHKIPKIIVICIIMSLGGTALLTWGTPSVPPNIGTLLCFLASIGYSFYIIFCSHILETNTSAGVLQFCQSIIFVILSIPLFIIVDYPTIHTFSLAIWSKPTLWAVIAFIGLCAGTIGYQLYFYGQKHTSPEITALILSCQNIFAGLADYFIFKINMTLAQKISYCLIFLSIVIVSVYTNKKPQVQK